MDPNALCLTTQFALNERCLRNWEAAKYNEHGRRHERPDLNQIGFDFLTTLNSGIRLGFARGTYLGVFPSFYDPPFGTPFSIVDCIRGFTPKTRRQRINQIVEVKKAATGESGGVVIEIYVSVLLSTPPVLTHGQNTSLLHCKSDQRNVFKLSFFPVRLTSLRRNCEASFPGISGGYLSDPVPLNVDNRLIISTVFPFEMRIDFLNWKRCVMSSFFLVSALENTRVGEGVNRSGGYLGSVSVDAVAPRRILIAARVKKPTFSAHPLAIRSSRLQIGLAGAHPKQVYPVFFNNTFTYGTCKFRTLLAYIRFNLRPGRFENRVEHTAGV
ncbi:hypothetical protein B0H11DRAFT_2193455 [Mycena galericulata]|nr:hypothetical protein B0H11DRAFT_2193455 [Mycena galericulata]